MHALQSTQSTYISNKTNKNELPIEHTAKFISRNADWYLKNEKPRRTCFFPGKEKITETTVTIERYRLVATFRNYSLTLSAAVQTPNLLNHETRAEVEEGWESETRGFHDHGRGYGEKYGPARPPRVPGRWAGAHGPR